MVAPAASEAELFGRLLAAENGELSPALARYVLTLDFPADDRERMHALAVRNQDGRLTKAELTELDRFVNVGHMLALLQSKARRSLKAVRGDR